MHYYQFLGVAIFIFLMLTPIPVNSQSYTDSAIRNLIDRLRDDRRGPYRDIKWFCDDGTIREARDPCPDEIGGVQHARYKEEILNLAERNHLFFGQILTGTEHDAFYDNRNRHSRLKQYIIEQFLVNNDDGWILEQAQFYRGAKQIEDEKEWGFEFFKDILKNNSDLQTNYLLLRLASKNIPHGEDTNNAQKVRAFSKYLGDDYPPFMNLRIKIHNNPEPQDLQAVKNFKEQKGKELTKKSAEHLDLLIAEMEEMYEPFDLTIAGQVARYMPESSPLKIRLEHLSNYHTAHPALKIIEICEILPLIRQHIYDTQWSEARLRLLDFTHGLEATIIQLMPSWEAQDLADLRDQSCHLVKAAYGLGYLEEWEYHKIDGELSWMIGDGVYVQDLEFYLNAIKKSIIWSTSLLHTIFLEDLNRYKKFEPAVNGFSDDLIRSTVLLPLGSVSEKLVEHLSKHKESFSTIFDINEVGPVIGLNPGISLGELVVLKEIPEDYHFDSKKIYVFDRPPGELPPVKGIANVQEGNPISHVQLLARNLGIPNALINEALLQKLDKYAGQEVFYAVSAAGTVIMKTRDDMTDEEKNIVIEAERSQKKIKVATDLLQLNPDSLLNMAMIDASYSGKWSGPKAANLGQLKTMFPDMVVEGIVLPFGIFKDHMEQEISGLGESYWDFLQRIFRDKEALVKSGESEEEINCVVIQELEMLQNYILDMPLKKSLLTRLQNEFKTTLGRDIGRVPVFIRSDTNMEDLPEFTGAGLNLTLFNILDENEIYEGIKKVWASPYSARSYRWRQSYLLNPEDVYPSILIIPSVNVDYSGVVITKGLATNNEKDITIAFSKGAGGAVDGQSAESYTLRNNGYNELNSPAREYRYRQIPSSGGSRIGYTDLTSSILNDNDMNMIRQLVNEVNEKMPKYTNDEGPYDIELGFKDGKIWLFQIRPFVENSTAQSSTYLEKISGQPENKIISLYE